MNEFKDKKTRKAIPIDTLSEAKEESRNKISDSNINLINNVHSFFEAKGVVDGKSTFEGAQTLDELEEFLDSSSEGELPEGKKASEFYDTEILRKLQEKEEHADDILSKFLDVDINL